MIATTVEEIAAIIGAEIVNLDPALVITEYPEIDSRKVTEESFFVALPGERVHGSAYSHQAIDNGARFAITPINSGIPSLIVEDTAAALLKLAAHARERLTSCIFIGITGSHGKTTTKDFLGHILSVAGECVMPEGSFNNEIGVPLTILRVRESTRFCIIEMGARHSGDIAKLCALAKPHIGIVLVVGTAHIGEFGSRAAIAKAKGELIDSLTEHGVAILGTYDPFTPKMGEGSGRKRITFGEKSSCHVRAADLEFREGYAHFDLVSESGRAPVSLRLLGAHQVANALAAAATALELGISIESVAAALSTAEPSSKWRMELHDVDDLLIINDSYNANPESVMAALRTLVLLTQERGGSSWAFLGKMHELGESEGEEHRAIGRLASELGVDHLVAVGTDLYLDGLRLDPLAGDEMLTHYFLTQEEALSALSHIQRGDVLLVKASRAEHLDELAEKLLANWQVVHE
jgi:UDP-N-acetylmuramoyl-tripeptide--D-alanyl-D-alanine ligase